MVFTFFFSFVLADFLSHLPTLFLVILLLNLNEYVCKLPTVIHIVVGCMLDTDYKEEKSENFSDNCAHLQIASPGTWL